MRLRWVCKDFRFRRRRCVFIFILALGLLILPLHFELKVIQVIQSLPGDSAVDGGSRHEEALPMLPVSVAEQRQLSATSATDDDGNLPLNSDAKKPANVVLTGEQLLCAEPQGKSRFRQLSRETLVFSLWFDNRTTQPLIRILLLASRTTTPSLTCKFESASKQEIFTTGSTLYEHNENHHLPYGGFIASCIVPQKLHRIPCSVNVSITSANDGQNKESKSIAFPVGLTDSPAKKTAGAKYGICVPPVHGQISAERIIEFIELSKILGASHFTFYDLAMNDRVRKVLSYYESKGLVSVLEWNLPEYIGKHNLHYFGQVLAIMDCLYRSMRDLPFVAFHDLDEFIVPLRHDNMNSVLEEIHKEQHCGHCFESVVFDPSTSHESTQVSPLLTQRIFYRTSQVTKFWTKCVVDPRKIIEQGIHHISKPIEERYQVDQVDWNIARVFHYRQCKDSGAAMQITCSSSFEVDKTMQKFGDRLMLNFQSAVNATNGHGKL